MIDCHWIGCKPCGSRSSQIKICTTLPETSASLATTEHAPQCVLNKQQVQTDYCFSWLDHQTDDAFPICSSGDISIFSVRVTIWIMKSTIWTCVIFNAHQSCRVSTGRICSLNQETGICSFYVSIHGIRLLKSVCSAVCVLWRAMSGLFSETSQPQ